MRSSFGQRVSSTARLASTLANLQLIGGRIILLGLFLGTRGWSSADSSRGHYASCCGAHTINIIFILAAHHASHGHHLGLPRIGTTLSIGVLTITTRLLAIISRKLILVLQEVVLTVAALMSSSPICGLLVELPRPTSDWAHA
jgi:hypothetical protein